MSVKSLLEELGYEDVIVFDDYGEETLIGVDSNNRAVYNYDKMIEWTMRNFDCTYEDAMDWIDYNTIRSMLYVGEGAPIVVYPIGKFIY